MTARLIDSCPLPIETSVAGRAERYRRGESPHTLHVWWARRPHVAMRALVFACLAPADRRNKGRAQAILKRLATFGPASIAAVEDARELLLCSRGGDAPSVLDMFSGGATIGFEAARLGADVVASENNQLAVFISRTLLERCPRDPARARLAELVERSGARVLDQLAEATAPLFPARGRAATYLWSYSIACPGCGARFFLSRRRWLSRRRDRPLAWLPRVIGKTERAELIEDPTPPSVEASAWVGRSGGAARCPACGAIERGIALDRLNDELIATAIPSGNGRSGKSFALASGGELPAVGLVRDVERAALARLGAELPSSAIPAWSGVINPPLYGIKSHADVLNPRQRAVMVLLLAALDEEHRRLAAEHGASTAATVLAVLSALVDQLVDWNCRLSMWIAENEQVGRAFSGPGVPMLWDYAETDPVGPGPSNLAKKLERIVAGVRAVVDTSRAARVEHAAAQALPFASRIFDAVVTDPPYYDNLVYSALADFFFAWKRIVLRAIEPELFAPATTETRRELVASAKRAGAGAHAEYERELVLAIGEAERVLKDDGVLALLYSHGSLLGWQALLRAFRSSGLEVTGAEPLAIERRARPRAVASKAVNACVVFVARKRATPGRARRVETVARELARRIEAGLVPLGRAGWHEDELAVAAFAKGVALLSALPAPSSEDGDRDALRAIEAVVQASFPRFVLAERSPI